MSSDGSDNASEGGSEYRARQLHREEYTPWWGPALAPFQSLVGMLPTHKDSRAGRRAARRVRIGLAVVGLILMLFGGTRSPLLAPIGVLLLGIAPFVPVTEMKKRTMANRLARWRRSAVRVRSDPLRLTLDDSRLTVESDSADEDTAESHGFEAPVAERDREKGVSRLEISERSGDAPTLVLLDDESAARDRLDDGQVESIVVADDTDLDRLHSALEG
ncbi:MAG: hypothetical protein ABEL76_08620 [Bradymonadaceae bacterium]